MREFAVTYRLGRTRHTDTVDAFDARDAAIVVHLKVERLTRHTPIILRVVAL